MILSAIGLWFRTNPRNVWLIAGLAAVIAVLAFAYLKGRSDNAQRERARDAIAQAEAITLDVRADEKSTAQVQRDAAQIADIQKELEHAVAQAPDSLPDAASVAYGCRELQRNGISTSDLPACQPAYR